MKIHVHNDGSTTHLEEEEPEQQDKPEVPVIRVHDDGSTSHV